MTIQRSADGDIIKSMRGEILWHVWVLGMALCLSGCSSRPIAPAGIENDLVGQTEAMVRAELGSPRSEFPGHYGNPTKAWADRFHGEIKSLVFTGPTVTVYVTFEKRKEDWIAICNSRVPNGTQF